MALRDGGTFLRVREVFVNSGLDPIRCHWFLADRLVLARFDPRRVSEALPDLAKAVGGVYDAKTEHIEFDPGAYRRLANQTLSERDLDDADSYQYELFSLALQQMSNSELKAAYESFDKMTFVSIPLLGGRMHPVIREYLDRTRAKFAGAANPFDPLEGVDTDAPPRVWFTPEGGPALALKLRNGHTRIF